MHDNLPKVRVHTLGELATHVEAHLGHYLPGQRMDFSWRDASAVNVEAFTGVPLQEGLCHLAAAGIP
jgi:hypothetical protein